jgi:hypothetical protein
VPFAFDWNQVPPANRAAFAKRLKALLDEFDVAVDQKSAPLLRRSSKRTWRLLMSESLSELLRPKVFTDLIQPTRIINILSKMAEQKTIVNMLFYGLPGVGKTSSGRMLMNALGDDCVEFNGSRDTGVDLVKRIESAAGSSGLFGGPAFASSMRRTSFPRKIRYNCAA